MRLGSYIFPEYFRPISTGIKTKFNKGKIAGEHGIVLPTGYYEPELITIGGTIVGKNRQEVEGIFNRMMQNVTNGAQDLCLGSLDAVENGRLDSWRDGPAANPTRWNDNLTVSQAALDEDYYHTGPYTALIQTTASNQYFQQVIGPSDFDSTKVRGIFWVRNANPSGGVYDSTFTVLDGSGSKSVTASVGAGEQKRVSVDFDSTGSQLYVKYIPSATTSNRAVYVDRIALIQRADNDEPEPGVYRDVQYAGHNLRYSPDDPDRMWEVEVTFQSPKPFIYEYTDFSTTANGVTTGSIPYALPYHLTGNVSVYPKLTLEFATLVSAEEIVITNTADSNSITIADRTSGLSTGTYIIDMDAKTITLDGSDASNLWNSGGFFKLDKLTSASTVTINSDASGLEVNITFEHANAWIR